MALEEADASGCGRIPPHWLYTSRTKAVERPRLAKVAQGARHFHELLGTSLCEPRCHGINGLWDHL